MARDGEQQSSTRQDGGPGLGADADFRRFVDVFGRSERFSGPSWYFHRKTLARRAAHASIESLLEDDIFFDGLYATLSNRVAFAWKLASLGVPTVLLYLGFLGDDGIRDVGEPFRDDAHWQRVFGQYSKSSVPPDLFERPLECGAAAAWFLVRSKMVLSPSPPAQPTS